MRLLRPYVIRQEASLYVEGRWRVVRRWVCDESGVVLRFSSRRSARRGVERRGALMGVTLASMRLTRQVVYGWDVRRRVKAVV